MCSKGHITVALSFQASPMGCQLKFTSASATDPTSKHVQAMQLVTRSPPLLQRTSPQTLRFSGRCRCMRLGRSRARFRAADARRMDRIRLSRARPDLVVPWRYLRRGRHRDGFAVHCVSSLRDKSGERDRINIESERMIRTGVPLLVPSLLPSGLARLWAL
jgi:hypothetical protein